ncbi:hypothetical protein KIPB_000615 [Kipferlia bialata]|uniref:Uncharacterized protein n=1 Tax=Kipferlia bialata TaxID=797122 RepID=A0A9K3CMM3_9EUKA|nr:hypothetical protein KIPB_000615 [Kipferlia bialata]|eukprot:g615.t1
MRSSIWDDICPVFKGHPVGEEGHDRNTQCLPITLPALSTADRGHVEAHLPRPHGRRSQSSLHTKAHNSHHTQRVANERRSRSSLSGVYIEGGRNASGSALVVADLTQKNLRLFDSAPPWTEADYNPLPTVPPDPDRFTLLQPRHELFPMSLPKLARVSPLEASIQRRQGYGGTGQYWGNGTAGLLRPPPPRGADTLCDLSPIPEYKLHPAGNTPLPCEDWMRKQRGSLAIPPADGNGSIMRSCSEQPTRRGNRCGRHKSRSRREQSQDYSN